MSLFQVLDVEFRSPLGIYIYLHHPGQFYNTDTKTKVPGKVGRMLFLDTSHDVSSNPKYRQQFISYDVMLPKL